MPVGPNDLCDGAVVVIAGAVSVVAGGEDLAGPCPFGELLDQASEI